MLRLQGTYEECERGDLRNGDRRQNGEGFKRWIVGWGTYAGRTGIGRGFGKRRGMTPLGTEVIKGCWGEKTYGDSPKARDRTKPARDLRV